jgi:hypothetical protein
MSFLDRLKSFFAGESSPAEDRAGHAHDAPREGESNLEAAAGLPPTTPVDPLGSPAPEAAPDPVTPPPQPPSDPDKL